MRALAIALLLPAPALATGLDCTFTTICAPQTDCQTHDGVPFRFDLLSGALSFIADGQIIFGDPLNHLTPPSYGALFTIDPDSTVLLTIGAGGDAVMTQHDVTPSGILSVSYFGICEPAA